MTGRLPRGVMLNAYPDSIGRNLSDIVSMLKRPEFAVTLDLNIGNGCASMLTCDFSLDYVKINADYRS